jgi:large subunit ribosomal protein L18
MGLKTVIKKRTARRVMRTRARIRKSSSLPRVSVHRSLNHIYAQLIDDVAQKTVVGCSSLELSDVTGTKKDIALSVGRMLAERAKEHGIVEAVFDRGRYLYHGRVQSVAQGLREGGLKI